LEVVELVGRIAFAKERLLFIEVLSRHEGDNPLDGEVPAERSSDSLDEFSHLAQPENVQRQEKHMEKEDGIQPRKVPVRQERHVARDGNASQGDHRLHVKSREHQQGRRIADQLDPVDVTDAHGSPLRQALREGFRALMRFGMFGLLFGSQRAAC
jgi:hypothetical protein